VPQLGVKRLVRVWRPPGVDVPGARFPVLYMYDAQNLFDRVTSAFGAEWRVDETLGVLVLEERLPPMMVVGIDNSTARPCEYAPFASDPHPGCANRTTLGTATNAFLAETLKPWIDARYPTLPDRAHTGIAGASMGGQLAIHAALTYPQLFSRAAALSPSFQNERPHPLEMPAYVRERGATELRAWLDMGDAETIRDLDAMLLVGNMKTVAGALREAGADVRDEVIPAGRHHESDWAARFRQVVTWLWASR